MRRFLCKTLSLFLTAALLCSLGLAAAASEALGEDLTAKDTLLNQQTQLSTNVFWSSAYSDLRTENLVTYAPNAGVTPMITFGDTLTSRSTVSAAARGLEAQGYRVVAGINGDFYNTSTGLPIGIVVSGGKLISSDAGYYAIGFRADGTAILGKPGVSVSADLGYALDDGTGYTTRVIRTVAGVNKARVSTGGIYLYTYEFNDRHTTGNTEAGVDVLCTLVDGALSIGSTAVLRVDQVIESSSATAIGPDQVVLSANDLSDPYYTSALRGVPVGGTITLSLTGNSGWEEVQYAVGALYSLVENGAVVSGLPSGTNPRTAVGVRSDGTVIFYTIDGRKSGHSIGASMTQVAQRMIELGCVTALCLDGGGSTTLAVTAPDETAVATVNTPSDGGERSVTNHLFLVASSQPSGQLSHFYVSAESDYVLAGSKVEISASAVDTHYIPMSSVSFSLHADGGSLENGVLTTPASGGDITVTASSGGRSGSAVVHAVTTPDSITVRDSKSNAVTSLSVAVGTATALTASAVYNHLSLKADQEAFAWTVTGGIGVVDERGVFTASAPGSGSITVSAGGRSLTIPVTVAASETVSAGVMEVESFEGTTTIFRGSGGGMDFSLNRSADTVRMGSGSGRIDYTLTEADSGFGAGAYTAQWRSGTSTDIDNRTYTALHMWVYGDGSGNILSLLYSNGTKGYLTMAAATLDFTGWRQVTVPLASEYFAIQGLQIQAPATAGAEGLIYADTARTGTVYIDEITVTASGVPDNTPPQITLMPDRDTLTAVVSDAVDGVPPRSSVRVTWDGAEQSFSYDAAAGGVLTTSLISDGKPHRITVTVRDVSGNIGRASYDVPTAADWTPVFTDTRNYWAAAYVDYLYNADITTGYADGTFRPDQNITRAQFSAMLYRYLGLTESAYADVALPFADLAAIPAYALPAVKALYAEGIINGTAGSDGRLYFNPGAYLTRAQAATMIGRTQEKGYATAELTFTDAAAVPAYAAYYIQTMVAQGVISGYTDGSFKPNANITRGQMAKILYTLM